MAAYRPINVFTQLKNRPRIRSPPLKKVDDMDDNAALSLSPTDREIVVTAVGEVSAPPDRCRITVKVTSKKETAQDAKNSVSRRLDYIVQTLHNHAVKDCDMPMFKHLSRVDSLYHMEADIRVQFADFDKCQRVSNLLVEKLDENVTVSLPEFFHANQTLENLRKQASLLAIHNAKQKAQEMAKFVHLAVGRPVYIREEETQEWEGGREGALDPENCVTVQDRIQNATITVSSKVAACFQLKPKVKAKVSKQIIA